MPTYYTPPQTPITTPSSSSSSCPSRSNSFSHAPSTGRRSDATPSSSSSSNNNRSRLSKLGLGKHDEADAEKKTKIPYFFLGSIAAASLLAHKCWPRGYSYGDKEDWELSGLALRAKQRRLAEKAEKAEKAARWAGGGSRRGSSSGGGLGPAEYSGYELYREERRGRGGGHYLGEGEEDRYRRDDRGPWDWESGGRERRGSVISRGRRMSRGPDRDYSADRYLEPSYRRATNRERTELLATTDRYYPPASKRYLMEQSASAAGSSSSGSRYLLEGSSSNAGSRFPGSSQQRYYEQVRPGEVVYIYRDPPARSRRASFDAGGVRRHDGEFGWYDR
ncbi:hypothetical protein C8A01DRAFT_31943 [Parachaetomium inaequale]|uniref:Uncharacterized protein n=1 Tax=Parachaetomium inaequale TaxID=2588326 RepID=A0AAN6PPX6_9PEZI|nr:hypothetical protein C8A01DRAFT_31943 [Parachaetomium inaequale]